MRMRNFATSGVSVCLSICLSVYPSVRHTHYYRLKTSNHSIIQFSPSGSLGRPNIISQVTREHRSSSNESTT